MNKSEETVVLHPAALATFLDRVGRSYPHGISEALLVAPREEVVATVVLIAVTPGGEALRGVQAELLEGVRVKGLRLSDGQCDVKIISDAVPLWPCVGQLLGEAGARGCVVFGSDKPPGSAEVLAETHVVHTYSLERIVHEGALKRELWKQLQEHILPLLEEP